MTYVTTINCESCGKTKYMEVRDTCQFCRKVNASQERRLYLASLKGLTVEERLEKIEAYIYDTNLSVRVSSLELKHMKVY